MASHPGLVLCVVALSLALPFHAAAMLPDDYQEPVVDSRYASLVRQYTTDVNFLSPLVEQFPHDPDVPSPLEFLGYVPGAPQKLTYYNKIREYMEALAAASANVRLYSMGSSNEGKEMIVVAIADARILDDLDRYRSYTKALADPRVTNEERAGEIIRVARPIYYLTGGLHSTETGSPEMLMELAYRLAVGQSKLVQRIRKHVITLITPVLETDGRERMVDWYYNVTIDYDDWDNMPPRHPPYWGKYVLHDNNRDGLQLTQPLSRNFAATFFKYHPQVVHDLHESIPLLYVSAGTGPYNDALDPIVTAEWQWIANHEVTELTKLGLPGVWTWGFYTGWWPGYLIWLANNHNSIGRFYETFGNAGASTFERELKAKFAGKEITTRQWYRPWPPEKKVEWSFRNTINYMETGALVALDFCARNGKALLYNYWKKGNNSLERGRSSAPYAFVIPRENVPAYELSHLLDTLHGQRVEIHVLDESVRLDGASYSEGDFVVRMDQPYGVFARSLLEPQRFPEDAAHTPYDDVAWTLPLLYGVDAEAVDNDAILGTRMTLIDAPPLLPGRAPRQRPHYLIPATPSCAFLAARIALADFDVYAADTSFTVRGREYPRGTWIIPGDERADELAEAVRTVSDELGLDVDGTRSIPDLRRHLVDIPRIAVFHTWLYTQDSGWLRYAFDRWRVPYTLINKDDVRDGNLRGYYDVIIIPDTGAWLKTKQLIHGVDTAFGPIPYRAGGGPSGIGTIDASDDITGGMGFEGLSELVAFVESGGTLVTFGSASRIPVELGIAHHVDRVTPSGFANPGSVVRATVVKGESPLVAGYPETTSVFRGNDTLLKVERHFRDAYTVLQYGSAREEGEEPAQDEEPICLSGMVRGAQHLDGKPAILDVPRGEGHIVLYTFNPVHRFLNLSDFGLAFNAILHWND